MIDVLEFFSDIDAQKMQGISLVITVVFIFIILWGAISGFWPFTKEFGLSGFYSVIKEMRHLKKILNQAIHKLPIEGSVKERREEFTKKFNEINDHFQKQSVFSHIWNEFTEQLVYPSDKEPNFQNSMRPENFFTLEYFLKKKRINLKLLESMPGILVGLGVLGTFTGLSLSLWLIKDILETKPSEAVKILIPGASVAFLTSVAGLLCSLIFNIISDKKSSVLQNLLNLFNSLLEKSLKFVTEEDLLKQNLKELQQQNKYLVNMDENIALKIGEHFGKIGETIQKSISQSNQNISEKFLENIAEKMGKGMGDFSKQQIENTEKTLLALQENIPPLISRLENSQKQSEQTSQALISQLATSSQDSQNQISSVLKDNLSNMKTEFEEITENLKEGMTQTLLDSSKELKNLLSSVLEKNNAFLKETEESKQSFQKDIDQTVEKFHAFTDQLNKIMSEFNNTTSPNIQKAIEKFSEAGEQQNRIVEKNEQYIHALA